MKQALNDRHPIKSPRSRFLAMASAYCLGVFNDNYFKQAAMLVAVTAGLSRLQGVATVLFALPFILFSSCGGWLADRFNKRKVVIGAKGLEVLAMLVGAVGLVTGNWVCILAMVFMMGLQSAFFNPALNGSIPELYPEADIPKANARLKLATTLAILAGIAAAGVSLDQNWVAWPGMPSGKVLVAAIAVLVSVMGFAASFGVYSRKAAAPGKPFPWLGPIHSLKDLIEFSRDRQLLLAIVSNTQFYFVASIAVLAINTLGLKQLSFSQTTTSLLTMSLMLGVCAGALLAARIVSTEHWSRYLVKAITGMASGLILAGLTPDLPSSLQLWWLAPALVATGIAGGLFLIPVTSFLQIRPSRSEKGRVLATANFCGFVGILVSGGIYSALVSALSPAAVMLMLGFYTLLVSVGLALLKGAKTDPVKSGFRHLFKALLSLRYSVEVKGLADIVPEEGRGIVFLPNHPAMIDPAIVMTALYTKFQPRPLADRDQANKPFVREIMKLVNPITLPDINKNGRNSKDRIRQAMEEVVAHLKNGEQIIMYPAGRLYRSAKEDLGGNSGVEYIVKQVPHVKVVLVRTTGLWGSSFSWATQHEPSLWRYLKKHLLALLGNGIFFGPRRKVTVELVEDTTVARLKDRQAINKYLQGFYNANSQPNTHVPYHWWQGSTPQTRPEPVQKGVAGSIKDVPASIRKMVRSKLTELSGQPVKGRDMLANDLGLDSLALMEFATWLENEFGVPIEDMTALETAEDCMLAANGQVMKKGEIKTAMIPETWFDGANGKLAYGPAAKLTDIFLTQAFKTPGKVVIADQLSGALSYRDILTGIFLLKPIIEQSRGDRIGIMLPASAGAAVAYLAVLFSGKTPVMFNWTVGIENMRHGIRETGVTHLISARPLVSRVEQQQGINLSSLKVEWLYFDEIKAGIKPHAKLMALFKAVTMGRTLARSAVSDTAAILFTSGSESKPKAVPLSHRNIIANLTDFSGVMAFTEDTRLLGMLPPFHSLGLVGTIILPLSMGLKTVYHTNPTESVTLARLIDAYKVSMVVGTPTFVSGILNAGSREQLRSLRLVFTGAEKCPDHLHNKLKALCPETILCEGYGITECSPLVSLNTPQRNRPGTIGTVLPSIAYAIVDEELKKRVNPGEKGILLLRGDSIFSGYLNDTGGSGFVAFDGKRWYNSGDYVVESAERVLTFCGRKKRFVKLGGEMISLPAIETILLKDYSSPGDDGPSLAVEASAGDGYPEIVLFSTVPIKREEANNSIRKAGMSALCNIRRVENIDEIPVLGTGKTDYKKLKERLAA